MKCANCKRVIPYDQGSWREVSGWERPKNLRSGASGSSLRGRKPTGRFLCGKCGFDLEHGLSSEQGSLAV